MKFALTAHICKASLTCLSLYGVKEGTKGERIERGV